MGFLDSDSEDSSSSGSGFALRKPVHKATAPAPAPAPAPMPANKQSILDESDSDEDSSDDDSSSTPMRAPAPAPAPVPMPVVVANRSRSSPDDSDSDDSSDGGVPAPKPVPVPTSAPEPTKKKTMLDDSDDSDDDTDDSPRKDGHPEKVAAAATKHETVAESSDVDSNEKNSAGSKTPAAEKDAPAEKPSVAKDEPLDSGKSEGKSDDASLAKEEDAPVNLANNEKDGTDSSQPHAKADISKDSASHEDNVFSTKSSTTKEDAPVNVASNSKDDDADSNKSSADTSERSNADLASDDSLDSNKTPIKIDELSDVESSSENSLDSPIKENPPAEDANLGSNADSFDPPPVQKHEITDDNPASKNSGIDPPPTKKDAPTNVDPKSDNASIESYESPVDPSEVELSSDDSLDSNKSPLKADVPSDSDISSNKSLDLNSENTKINTPQADKCFACGLENEMVPDGLISCSRCKQVPYCSADCLQWHWESHHKAECAGITDTERTSEPAPKIGNQESDTSLDILGSANDEDKQPQSEQGVMVAVAASRSNTAVGPICQDKCVACGMEKEMVPGGLICCSKCQQVPYCSTDCLEWHWESHHKAECTGITDTERTSEPAPKIGNQESDTSLDILGSANDEYKQPHSQQGIMAAVAASRPPTAAGGPIQEAKCIACGLEKEMVPGGLISCSRCKQVPYCSADCLEWHWESHHKAECTGITDTERTSEPASKISQESDTSLDILGSANDEYKQPHSQQGIMAAVAASRPPTAAGPICQDKCVACGMEKEMVPGGLICCSKCQQVPYCSTDCLEWHWESHHKAECTGITDTERTSEPAPKKGNQESDTSLDILGSANDEYKQPHSQQGIMAAVAASRPPTAAGPIQQAKCIACGLEKEMVPDGLISCSKCKQVPYCSTDCLEWHWESHHKAECTGITDTERTSEPASKISQESDTSLDILGSANGEYNHPKSQQGIMAAVAASKYQTITEKPNLTLSESKAATDDEDAPTKIESMLQLHRLEEENCKKEAEIERLRKENSQLKADESRLLEETRQKAVEAAEARIKAQLEEQLKLKEEELLEKSHQVTIDRLVELEALKKSAEASRIAKEEKQEAYAARLAEERRLADEVRLAELAKHKEAALEARLAKEARLEEERIAKQKRELQEKEYDLLERERFAAADAASREAILRPARLATARLDRRAERFRKEEEEERRAKVKGEEERSMLAMMEEDKMESLEKERLAVERAAARERDVESLASSSDLDRAKAARDADVWAEEVKDLSSASTFDFSDPVSDPREQIQDDRGNLEECLESFRLNNLVELLDVELPTRLSEGNAARMQQLTKILSNNRFVKEVSIVVPSRMESSLSRHSDLSTMFEAIGSLQNLKELNIISSSAGATKNTRSSLSSRFINSALCKIAHMHKTKNRGYVQKEGGLVSLSIANMVLVDTHADLTHLVDSLEIINQIPTLKTAQVEIEFTS